MPCHVWVTSRTNRRSSQTRSNCTARRRDRNSPRADFVLGNVPHQWIPLASADRVIPFVTQGGTRFATANLPYPGLRCQNAFGVCVASQSLADHIKMCITTRAASWADMLGPFGAENTGERATKWCWPLLETKQLHDKITDVANHLPDAFRVAPCRLQ